MSRTALLLGALAALLSCHSADGQKPKAGPAPGAAAPAAPSAAPADTQRTAPADRPVQTDITAQDYAAAPLPRAKVTLADAFGGRQVVQVEVAATRDARTRGLMWRTELAEGQGMLFIFPQESVQGFWMRNTLIPLDMLYLAQDGKVVGIVERAEPQTLVSRSVGKPSKYVLEVPGGWCAKKGIATGAKVTIEGAAGIAVED